MGKGSSAPAVPDPYETASAEAQFNRFDTYGPGGGGVRYGYTDEAGNFAAGVAPEGYQSAQTYVESPYEQAIRQALEPASTQLVDRIVSDNITGMPDAARAQDFGAVADQLFKTGYNRMQPQFEAENNRMLANLQARGIPVGSEAFNEAYAQQQQSVNDALNDLTTRSTAAAGAEQSRQFGLDSAERANAISELVAAMGGNYNPPNSIPNGSGAGVDYSGLVGQQYNAEMNQYNARQQQTASTMGSIGTLGAALIAKSDRRLKTDIVHLGWRGPLRLYGFRYIWETPGIMHAGYMAQEVIKHFPEAVHKIGAWFSLDYGQLPEVRHA